MSKWYEIKNEYIENNIVFLDGYITEDPNEEGKVIAKVDLINRTVEYIDEDAKTDNYAQEVIQWSLDFIEVWDV